MPSNARARSVAASAPNSIVWRSKSVSVPKKRPICSGSPTLLWVDDFQPGLELYRTMFEGLGFKVLTAASGKHAVRLAAENLIDVVVTDYEMPGMNGEAVATAIKSIKPKVPVVLFSGSTLVSPRARRVVDAFCDKAGSRNQLSATIHRVLQKKRSRALQPPPASRASHEGHGTVA
jgi:CheY-like chemotaxis protein